MIPKSGIVIFCDCNCGGRCTSVQNLISRFTGTKYPMLFTKYNQKAKELANEYFDVPSGLFKYLLNLDTGYYVDLSRVGQLKDEHKSRINQVIGVKDDK